MHNAVPHVQAQLMPEHEWRMTMTKALLAMMATVGVLLGAPALAADRPEPTVATTPAPAPDAQSKKVRYCIKDAITGSRMERRICKTRAEWLQQGVDPTAR